MSAFRFVYRASAVCFMLCILVILAMICAAFAGFSYEDIRGIVVMAFEIMGVSCILMFISSKLS